MIDEIVLALGATSALSMAVGAIANWIKSKMQRNSEVDLKITNSRGESVTFEAKSLRDLSHEELVELLEQVQQKLAPQVEADRKDDPQDSSSRPQD